MTDEATADAATKEEGADEERHATNLELFLDLVFVFAVTQITGELSHHLNWSGVGRDVSRRLPDGESSMRTTSRERSAN